MDSIENEKCVNSCENVKEEENKKVKMRFDEIKVNSSEDDYEDCNNEMEFEEVENVKLASLEKRDKNLDIY